MMSPTVRRARAIRALQRARRDTTGATIARAGERRASLTSRGHTRPPARQREPLGGTVRAIRGATTVAADEADAVREATRELLASIVARNAVRPADLISALFTVTPDLTSAFPARAACELGWVDVPLLCALEIPVPGALPRCIRVLLHVTSDRPRALIEHVYLRDAVALRPDLATPRGAGDA